MKHDSSNRQDPLLISMVLGLAVAIYNILLLERKYSILTGTAGFLSSHRLGVAERVVFVIMFVCEVLLLLYTAARLIAFLIKKVGRIQATAILAPTLSVTIYFCFITIQFQVYAYFREAIDARLAALLGGGDIINSMYYVQQEITRALPQLIMLSVVFAMAIVLAIHYLKSAKSLLLNSATSVLTCSMPALLLANIAAGVLVFLIGISNYPLHRVLCYSLAHQAYVIPITRLTDFDLDGYGLIGRPADSSPFNAAIHPYALDIPGNGIDDNCLGGDLPVVEWNRDRATWNPAGLSRKNVLVIVIESARYDLLQRNSRGDIPMPFLASTPGFLSPAFSHTGFTTPSVTAILTGAPWPTDERRSLFARFRGLGYRTGVFSGQSETFGNIRGLTGMDAADVFYDANTKLDLDQGRSSTRRHASVKVPVGQVRDQLLRWIGANGGGKPFFAYVNLQELHFPYHYPEAKLILTRMPIPRRSINEDNRSWLRDTYQNAARNIDSEIKDIISNIDKLGLLDNTIIAVTGDHGEELFDHGYLGHGTNLSLEQYMTFFKLINGASPNIGQPFFVSDIEMAIRNSLTIDDNNKPNNNRSLLLHVGSLEMPRELGMVFHDGLVKYNFTTGEWWRQPSYGAKFVAATPRVQIIRHWESYMNRLDNVRQN